MLPFTLSGRESEPTFNRKNNNSKEESLKDRHNHTTFEDIPQRLIGWPSEFPIFKVD